MILEILAHRQDRNGQLLFYRFIPVKQNFQMRIVEQYSDFQSACFKGGWCSWMIFLRAVNSLLKSPDLGIKNKQA